MLTHFSYKILPSKIKLKNQNGHFGITGPLAWTWDPEMLDSEPRFPEISAQKTHKMSYNLYHFGPVCLTPKDCGLNNASSSIEPDCGLKHMGPK